MPTFPNWSRAGGLFIAILLTGPAAHAEPTPAPRCVADLKKLSRCELDALFAAADMGPIPCGDLDGCVLCLADRFARLKVFSSNLVWRGKYLDGDNYVSNRWIGHRRRIGACYITGPSWVDGRPALIVEYAPGTPIFANVRDELREVAPGVYLGIMFDRAPCPKFRGYFAIETPKCGTGSCLAGCQRGD